jgi:hypothetical protein
LARHDAVGGRDTLLADAIGTFTRLGADRQLRIAREA